MNKCQRCNFEFLATINAKCSDLCFVEFMGHDHDGYVPGKSQLCQGSEDYVAFDYCPHCGQIQGDFSREVNILKEFLKIES